LGSIEKCYNPILNSSKFLAFPCNLFGKEKYYNPVLDSSKFFIIYIFLLFKKLKKNHKFKIWKYFFGTRVDKLLSYKQEKTQYEHSGWDIVDDIGWKRTCLKQSLRLKSYLIKIRRIN
jgi:hypothetical protein